MFDKLINNKKILIAAGILVLALAGFLIYRIVASPKTSSRTDDEYTDSTAAINDADVEAKVIAENPIIEQLPVGNSKPYYIIAISYAVEEETLVPSIEITYETDAGKSAAETRLGSEEFAKYNPSQYKVVYQKTGDCK